MQAGGTGQFGLWGAMDPIKRPIFLSAKPGLEETLADEARALGFFDVVSVQGGVEIEGGSGEIMRANLMIRGAERVLWRVAQFRAMHLAQLDKRARKLPWRDWLPRGAVVSIEATCRKSKIYHQGAAKSRIAGAVDAAGTLKIADTGGIRVMARIEDDLCTISLDTSGGPLHRRGHKQSVGKAPMRETMASLFLRECGYRGDRPVLDPMCGSGTFPIEAAEIAMGLAPGHSREFAFQSLRGFDADEFAALKNGVITKDISPMFFGSDRDNGAIHMARENAERAGVDYVCEFQCKPLAEIAAPAQEPGLLIANPPYGGRIGNKKLLFGLYAKLGEVVRERFPDWQVGLITSEDSLAKATGLDLTPGRHVAHGGLKVRLWQS